MEYIWAFERGTDRLEIRRTPGTDQLIISGEGMSRRVVPFDTSGDLVDFQIRFEEHLLRTGWRFVQFSPERRRGERRVGPTRRSHDRRKLLQFPGR